MKKFSIFPAFTILVAFCSAAIAQSPPACKAACDTAVADARVLCSLDLGSAQSEPSPRARQLASELIIEQQSAGAEITSSAAMSSMSHRHTGVGRGAGRAGQSFQRTADACKAAEANAKRTCIGQCPCRDCEQYPNRYTIWTERASQANMNAGAYGNVGERSQ